MRNVLKRFLRFIFFADLDDKIYRDCIDDIKKANMGAINAVTLVCSIVFACVSVLFLRKGILMRGYVNLLYLFPVLSIQIGIHIRPPKKGATIAILGVMLMVILYTYGILIGVIYNIQNCSVTFVAIILAISILFVERPYRIQGIGAIFTFIMCALSIRYKTPDLSLLDTLNAVSFFLASCYICPYLIKGRVGGFYTRIQLEKERDLDSLTQIYQRGTLSEKVTSYFTKHENDQCAMMIIDVDNFKQINDSYGHPTGDKVLKALAKSLYLSTTAHGYCGRYGGDEFCAFYFGIQDDEEPIRHAKDFISTFKSYAFSTENGEELHPTISVGIALSDPETRSFKKLIKKADVALYKAKESGKDRYYMD